MPQTFAKAAPKFKMNNKTIVLIREACETVQKQGLTIAKGGAWLVFVEQKIVACDPIAAALIANNKLPALNSYDVNIMSNPGLVQIACDFLEIDRAWLYRFWMGFDRVYQIIFINDKEKNETKDEVSAFGILLRRELFKD